MECVSPVGADQGLDVAARSTQGVCSGTTELAPR